MTSSLELHSFNRRPTLELHSFNLEFQVKASEDQDSNKKWNHGKAIVGLTMWPSLLSRWSQILEKRVRLHWRQQHRICTQVGWWVPDSAGRIAQSCSRTWLVLWMQHIDYFTTNKVGPTFFLVSSPLSRALRLGAAAALYMHLLLFLLLNPIKKSKSDNALLMSMHFNLLE